MAYKLSDTLLSRIISFHIGIWIMLSAAVVALALWVLYLPSKEIEDEYQEMDGLRVQLQKVHQKQAKTKASLNYDVTIAAKKLIEQPKP